MLQIPSKVYTILAILVSIIGTVDTFYDGFNIPTWLWTIVTVFLIIWSGIYTWAFELNGKTIQMINDEYLEQLKKGKIDFKDK